MLERCLRGYSASRCPWYCSASSEWVSEQERPASACLDTHQATSHRITVGNPHCICIETICFHDVSGTLELLLQGPGMAIAEPKKNNRHLLGEENAALIAKFLCQVYRLLNSTMLCPLVIQRLTFDGFFFFRFIHLLRVLGISRLSYITSRTHSALFA